ncbi:MAG TPA: hypothetical protein VFV52_09515, partial [Bacilli bacterium]|nr:hypothetical protein [Bacilli bacterium]
MSHGTLPVEVNTARWNRKILNVYWIVVCVSVLMEGLSLFLSQREHMEFLLNYILLPTAILCAVVGLTEYVRKRKARFLDYCILFAGSVIAAVLMFVHNQIEVIFAALFLPLLVSVVYFSKP